MKMPQQHTVRILLHSEAGTLSYTPTAVHAEGEDSILWQSAHPFAIEFAGISPCDVRKGTSDSQHCLRMEVWKNSAPGSYKYFVAVWDKTGKVVTDDPVIIIERRAR